MTARTVPTMPDWLAGQKMTATLLNQITTYSRFWSSPPGFRMYQTVVQSCANATDVQITMDSSAYDSDSGRAAGTPWSYTIPVGMTGRWTFTVCTMWASNATGMRSAQLRVNGANPASDAYGAFQAVNGNISSATVTATIPVNAGDVITAWGRQESGGALNTSVAGLGSSFEGFLKSLGSP